MATAVTSSIETKPVKAKPKVRIRKTRKRKKKGKNYYFNIGTEKAIIRYNKTDDARLKNIIYNEHIRAAFDKLAENIIHTFKFYYFDVGSVEVKHEVVSFLVMNIHKFKEGKGKAYDLGYGEQYQREQIADNGFFGKLMRETEKREAVANEIK